jgi:hypothetical protein
MLQTIHIVKRSPEGTNNRERGARQAPQPRRMVANVDPRRQVPEPTWCSPTGALVAARELLGGALVKAAVTRAQDLARSGAVSPADVADAAAAALPRIAASLTR